MSGVQENILGDITNKNSNNTSTNTNINDQKMVEMFQAYAKTNPSLAREFASFVLDETPDTNPVTKESNPLFYNSSKNSDKYTYQPKKGFGVHKDGTKLHGFTYDCVSNARSKDYFGAEIEDAKRSGSSSSGTINTVDIHALADALVAAYSDLVLNANDDMQSYLYLTREAKYALSPAVRDELKLLEFDQNGGIALALVTELIATTANKDELYKKAVQARADTTSLVGIEALNEENLIKFYGAILPSGETKGLLLNNGILVDQSPWAQKLVEIAPTLDDLVQMEFSDLQSTIEPSGVYAENSTATPDDLYPDSLANYQNVVHEMFAGLLGTPRSAYVPPVRRYMLENGLDLAVANELENMGYEDLNDLSDKDVYNVTKEIRDTIESRWDSKLKDQNLKPDAKIKLEKKANRLRRKRDDGILARKLMQGRQSSLRDVETMKRGRSRQGLDERRSRRQNIFGRERIAAKAPLGSKVRGEVTSNGIKDDDDTGLDDLGSVGGLVGKALALAPMLQKLADDTERTLNEDFSGTRAERLEIAREVQSLLQSVQDLSTEENLQKQQQRAKDLLLSVNKPDSFVFSMMQGLELQNGLESFATRFGATNMEALQPYDTNEDLVASVDSGKALCAVSLFLDIDDAISSPPRQLLQTPKYVNMMGVSQPFRTLTSRSTSEMQMNSFIKSTSSTGFSTADKTRSSNDTSSQGKGNVILAGSKGNLLSSDQNLAENRSNYSNDKQFNEEENIMLKQAIVTEFTYMPMQTFSLREGGLMLSNYAFYRLNRIINNDEINVVNKELDEYYRAKEFLLNFGSHIPFGVQTLGGIFARTMKITTRQETKLTELYSAAAVELSKVNALVSSSVAENGTRVGLFGLGGSATSSSGISSASSSGYTQAGDSAFGNGEGKNALNATFESNVMCFGPNAPTQDGLYQQLLANNKTWTVIDRGDPDSYFAIWDFIYYIGQGQVFDEQCKLLQTVWEDMALGNSERGDEKLLNAVMKDYPTKRKMFDLVEALIYCIVPSNTALFNPALAQQFGRVLKAAAGAQVEQIQDDPTDFINAGFDKLNMDKRSEGISQPETPLFQLIEGNIGYKRAKEILIDISSEQWITSFMYSARRWEPIIIEKAKAYNLLFTCRSIMNQDIPNSWKLVKALVSPSGLDIDRQKEEFDQSLIKSLRYKDEETGWHCLHYSLQSKNIGLVEKLYKSYPHAAYTIDNDGRSLLDLVVGDLKFTDLPIYLKDKVPPRPKFFFDFSDPDTLVKKFSLHGGAAIKTAPGEAVRALRIDGAGKYARLDGIDISPSSMPTCTIAIGVFIDEEVPRGLSGFAYGHVMGEEKQGIWNRGILVHNNPPTLGVASSYSNWDAGTIRYPDENGSFLPETRRWVHIVAVYRSKSEGGCDIYIDGLKARRNVNKSDVDAGLAMANTEVEVEIDIDASSRSTYLGNLPGRQLGGYGSWINEVKIFDRDLDDDEVNALWLQYYHGLRPKETSFPQGSEPFGSTFSS